MEMSTITVQASNADLYSAPMATEDWGFLNVQYLLWHIKTFKMVISEDLWNLYRVPKFGNGDFATCFKDLCLSPQRFEPPISRTWGVFIPNYILFGGNVTLVKSLNNVSTCKNNCGNQSEVIEYTVEVQINKTDK